jgi:Tfp pilus assembly protein PilN
MTSFAIASNRRVSFCTVTSDLNLASKPFSNRLLPWALTAVILFISLIGLVVVVRLTTVARGEARTIESEIAALRQQEQSLLKGAEEVKNSLNAEQQLAVPAAHQLVDRRNFSWSRLLVDLEASLPPNVRVLRIAVRDVTKQGDQTIAGLELVVFTKNPATMSEMIADMHDDGIFQADIRAQNLSKGRGEQGTEYELYVVYRPRPGYAQENVAEVTAGEGASKDSSEVSR